MQPSESQPPTTPQDAGDGQTPAVGGPPQSDVPAQPTTTNADTAGLASNVSGIEPVVITPTQPAGATAGTPATPELFAMPTPSAWTDPAQTAQSVGTDNSAALTGLSNESAPATPTTPATLDGPLSAPIAPAPRPRKRKLLFASIAAAAVLLLAGGVVFGWYLPNTPDNVWKTGMSRTGQALDKLTQSATDADKIKTYKTSEVDGSIDVTTNDVTYSGTFQMTSDKNSADGGLNVALKSNGQTVEVGADVLAEIAEGGVYPDVYLRLTGLSDLGLDDYFPKLSTYDNKWIFLSADTLESLGGGYLATGEEDSKGLNAKEAQELTRAVTNVTREYVFTTAEDKAVFVKRSFVGKEKTAEGVDAYHYKVGINSQHADAYCVALTKAVLSTKAYQNLSGLSDNEVKEEQDSAADSCKAEAGDAIKSTDTFDMWIDSKYKLVHKIRITDNGGSSYADIGQVYKGGDKLSLFVVLHDGSGTKGDGKLTMDVDLKTYAVDAKFAYKTTGDDATTIKATLRVTGSDKDVTITKPTPTVPAETFLEDVFGGLLGGL